MAYDPELANRLRELLAGEPDVTERAMFGGVAFMISGNLAVSASGKGGLLLRVDPTDTDALVITDPNVERAVMGGQTMDGWLRVQAPALDGESEFARWVGRGVDFARTLTPK